MPIIGTPITSGGYEGRYTSEEKVEQYLGTLNLDAYGDVDNDNVRDAGAVQQAIVSGEARVDYYRDGPFDVGDGTSVGAQLLETWSRKLAAIEVARKRIGKPELLNELEEQTIIEMKEDRDLPGVEQIEDEADDDEVGVFQFVPINRGVCTDEDEFSSD